MIRMQATFVLGAIKRLECGWYGWMDCALHKPVNYDLQGAQRDGGMSCQRLTIQDSVLEIDK